MLLRVLARLLRPLVRLLIQSGVTCPALADLLRGVYIDVARTELLTDPKARTDSRVALLTGIHRKELRKHRVPEDPASIPPIVTRASAIIAHWLGAPGYSDATRAPLPLPRGGPAPSFESLVAAVTRDVRARAVLDEWLAQGIVSLDGAGMVRLDVAAFIPPQGSAEGRTAQLFYFARNLHDHLAAAGANLVASGPAPFVDRSLHYDRLSPDAAAQLEAAGRAAAQAMLVDLNRAAITIADAEGATPPPGAFSRRVNVGVYVYIDDDAPQAKGGADETGEADETMDEGA
jgi:hypothetical protein